MRAQFATACEEQRAVVAQIPRAQLESMAQRLRDIGPKADVRAVRLKFLEHKVSEKQDKNTSFQHVQIGSIITWAGRCYLVNEMHFPK